MAVREWGTHGEGPKGENAHVSVEQVKGGVKISIDPMGNGTIPVSIVVDPANARAIAAVVREWSKESE